MFEDQINCGVEFLNDAQPNWLNLIDVDSLDMQSTKNCILGQIHGGFYYSLMLMSLSEEDTIKMGFISYDLDYHVWCTLTKEWKDHVWGTLTKEWKEKITSLKGKNEDISCREA